MSDLSSAPGRGAADPNVAAPRNTAGEDAALAEGMRRRDPHAMELLYDRLSRRAFGLAYRILGDGPLAEDAVQDAFLTVWRQAERVDLARGKLASFVLTVVHHRAIDLLRTRKGLAARQLPLEAEAIQKEDPDPSERVALSLDGTAERQALQSLPDDQRQSIEMAYYEGLTHVEIAQQLRVPLGTVKSRLRLGLEKMRAALGMWNEA